MLHNAHIYFMHTLKWVKYFVFAFSNLLLLLPACYLFAKFITSGIVAYKASRKPSQQRANEFKQIPTHTNTHRQIDSLIHPPHWLHFIVTAADCCKKFELLNVCYSYHNVFCFFFVHPLYYSLCCCYVLRLRQLIIAFILCSSLFVSQKQRFWHENFHFLVENSAIAFMSVFVICFFFALRA